MEWFASSIGAVFAGYEVVLVTELATNVLTIIRGLSTGIYTTNSPEACHYILENSRANIVVVDHIRMGVILKVWSYIVVFGCLLVVKHENDENLQITSLISV